MSVGDAMMLDHLDRMTDSTGLIQHAIYSLPRRESGYTTDDNARALRLCTRLWNRHPDDRMLGRISCLFELFGARPVPRSRIPQFPELPAGLARCERYRRLSGPGGRRACRSVGQQATGRISPDGAGIDCIGPARAGRTAERARRKRT